VFLSFRKLCGGEERTLALKTGSDKLLPLPQEKKKKKKKENTHKLSVRGISQ
jgi:hypothetical protein